VPIEETGVKFISKSKRTLVVWHSASANERVAAKLKTPGLLQSLLWQMHNQYGTKGQKRGTCPNGTGVVPPPP